ncbi:unnamed protein product [Hymenolepis diminuta]|uniref:Uncharacterized protein n=1 Tax=Hymenolepis diminuta TaxID=6216 RepID=A0A564Z5N1_HYMDI|nr:unnamed protein product [Hymenolepis diminuta]
MASRAVPRRTFKFDSDYYSTRIPKRPIPVDLLQTCSFTYPNADGQQSLHSSRSSSRSSRHRNPNKRAQSRGGNGRGKSKIFH